MLNKEKLAVGRGITAGEMAAEVKAAPGGPVGRSSGFTVDV